MKVIFRTDINPQIGSGHFMRCLALAEALKTRGDDVCFVTSTDSTFPIKRVEDSKMEVFYNLSNIPFADWVILDGYHFDFEYQNRIRESGSKLLVIDDYASIKRYCADIILDQNVGTNSDLYTAILPDTKLLLGSKYVLLRSEFIKYRNFQRINPDIAKNILITLGGGDDEGASLKIIEALDTLDMKDLNIRLIAGANNPNLSIIEQKIAKTALQIELLQIVEDMPEQMIWADMGITAGGTTLWEALYLGLPLISVILAENQRQNVETLAQMKLLRNLGWNSQLKTEKVVQELDTFIFDKTLRRLYSANGKKLIDGCGTERVGMFLKGEKIWLRRASADDCIRLFEWNNESEARRLSFNSKVISWEEHNRWFISKFNDQNCVLYIGMNEEDNAVGMVRFDLEGEEAVISVNTDSSFRGKGYGTALIQLGTHKIISQKKITSIRTFIKSDNISSLKAFTNAKYRFNSNKDIKGNKAIEMLYSN
jgi:UDP-2,4-diacetamido-2,4,6-trideoxy-beta-L-altropyranose hydrolase